MALHLGYRGLEQTTILKSYIPNAHIIAQNNNHNYHQSAKSFYESGAKLNEVLYSFYSSENRDIDEDY